MFGAKIEFVQKSKMAGVCLGFSGLKIERRRPSKRETTTRTFAIIRNWNSNATVPSDATTATVLETPGKVIPTHPTHQKAACSPQYPKQTWQSTPVKDSFTDSDKLSTKSSHDSPTEYGILTESPTHSPLLNTRSDSIDDMIPDVPPSLSVSGSVDNKASVAVDAHNTSSSHIVLSTPHTDDINEETPDVVIQKDTARRVTRQRPSAKPQSDKEHKPKRVARGRKRKQDDLAAACDEAESEQQVKEFDANADNRFVRIYNADQGRKVSVTEITDLDVALTAIEEEALQYREEVESDSERQCIKEYFIQVRKSFGVSIDLHKESKGIQSDLRKAKSQLSKHKSELLEVQKKRTRLKGRLEKLQKEQQENNQNNKDLQEINTFVHQMKTIQKTCPKKSHDNIKTLDCSTIHNLPSLMCQMQALLMSMTRLQGMNKAFERWLNSY